jgi:hypothetical protein
MEKEYPKFQASLVFGKANMIVVRDDDSDDFKKSLNTAKEIIEDLKEEIDDKDLEEAFKKEEVPRCPKCGSLMVERVGKSGNFWGCPKYPDCQGTRSRK